MTLVSWGVSSLDVARDWPNQARIGHGLAMEYRPKKEKLGLYNSAAGIGGIQHGHIRHVLMSFLSAKVDAPKLCSCVNE